MVKDNYLMIYEMDDCRMAHPQKVRIHTVRKLMNQPKK